MARPSLTSRFALVLTVILSALSPLAQAQQDSTAPEAPSGSGPAPEENSIQVPAPDASGLLDQDPVLDYLRAIENAESAHGAYATELVDLYHGLGGILLETGDLEGARDAFHRTALVSRVNSGPKSIDQSIYLYSIAEIETKLGNPRGALGVLNNIYELNAAFYGPGNPALLPEVTKIHDWYLENRPLQGPGVRAADFENLTFLANRIALLTEAANGLGHRETAMRYRALGQLHFRALHHIVGTGEIVNTDLVLAAAEPGEMFAARAPRRHFVQGELAYQLAAEAWLAMEDATGLERAEAIAQLADWYLAVKNFTNAHEQYGRAYRLLTSEPDSDTGMRNYLHDPSPLRFLATENTFVRKLTLPPGPKLAVSMSVTRNGLLSEIEFLNPPAGDVEEQLDNLRKQLRNTRFRPAIIEGKAERIDGYVWNIPLKTGPSAAENAETDEVPE